MEAPNPVIESARYAHETTDLVQLNPEGISAAAAYIQTRMLSEAYTPRTWRTHPLHLCPPEPYAPSDARTRHALDWVFLVSSLNFSFWSALPEDARFGIAWRAGWGRQEDQVWTGYWSLLAAIDRALEEGIPITDPAFYASPQRCPDELIANVFRAAPGSEESIPLLAERIAIMRECGAILVQDFGGSFAGFIDTWQREHGEERTALQLVQAVTHTFPSFRDETTYAGHKVYIWKRAQILVAETWAAFHPPQGAPHPLFPHGINQLTMFADYRVPQLLHHLRILTYPHTVADALRAHTPLAHGSRQEVSIRAASVLAVESVRERMREMRARSGATEDGEEFSSVMIDFYLWDLAKRLEGGEKQIEGLETDEMLPPHRTRSIWY